MKDLMQAINYIKAVETLLNPFLSHVKEEDHIKLFILNALCHLENAVLLNTTGSITALENKVKALENSLEESEQKRISLVKDIENFIKKIKETYISNTNITME